MRRAGLAPHTGCFSNFLHANEWPSGKVWRWSPCLDLHRSKNHADPVECTPNKLRQSWDQEDRTP